MQKRSLGSTEILVSPIGLGTVKLGRNTQVKYPEHFSIPNDEQAVSLLHFAQNLGVNVLDTAPAYGNSEERLGKLLSSFNRKEWVIITKVGEEFEKGESFFDFTPEHTILSVKRSLKRLNTDFLDCVLVHSDGNDVYNIQHFGVLECLAQLKKQGYIRSFGMSTKTVAGGLLALEHSDVVMVTYNPIHTEEHPVIVQAKKLNKGVIIKKALASGHLNKFNHTENAVEHSLKFIFKEPVSTVIIGTINQAHLQQAVNCI